MTNLQEAQEHQSRQETYEIISRMLDNPDKYGIYPTTKAYDELEKLIDAHARREVVKVLEELKTADIVWPEDHGSKLSLNPSQWKGIFIASVINKKIAELTNEGEG